MLETQVVDYLEVAAREHKSPPDRKSRVEDLRGSRLDFAVTRISHHDLFKWIFGRISG